MNSFLIFIVFFIFFIDDFVYSISCMDEFDNSREWIVAVKLPSQPSEDKFLKDGTQYFYKYKNIEKYKTKNYLTQAIWNQGNDIGSEISVIGSTLKPVYDNPKEYSYVQYGDKSPINKNFDSVNNNKKSFFGQNYAYGKGILVWNSGGAVWLIYNAPESFPPFSDKDSKYFTKSSLSKGHNYLCLSLQLSDVNVILNHLIIARTKVYSIFINPDLKTDDLMLKKRIQENIDALQDLEGSKLNDHDVYSRKSNINTNKVGFNRFKKHLYTKIPSLNDKEFFFVNSESSKRSTSFSAKLTSPIYLKDYFTAKSVSFFQKLKSKFKSNCGQSSWISKLKNRPKDEKKIIFWGKNDSFWRICDKPGEICYCVGDFKRSIRFYKRGGLEICIYDKVLHELIKITINEQEC